MRYIEAADIKIIHDQIVTVIGGGFGLREPELLESIAAKPQLEFGGHELYPDLFTKAAALYEALCNYHVFIDGNKRTAAITMYRFLALNDFDLTATNEELETFTLDIATAHPDLADIAAWIKHHSAPIDIS
jgi:death-on-curing protein